VTRDEPFSRCGSNAVAGVAPKVEKQQKSALAFFGRDITELARRGKLEPVIGRKDEILRVARILSQKRKANPVLVGEPGSGKTGIVEGLAQWGAWGQSQNPALSRAHRFRIDTTPPINSPRFEIHKATQDSPIDSESFRELIADLEAVGFTPVSGGKGSPSTFRITPQCDLYPKGSKRVVKNLSKLLRAQRISRSRNE